jgi:hypothetical protein
LLSADLTQPIQIMDFWYRLVSPSLVDRLLLPVDINNES